jgi:Sulfotransferase family
MLSRPSLDRLAISLTSKAVVRYLVSYSYLTFGYIRSWEESLSEERDRRDEWSVPERPAWVKEINEIGALINLPAVIPLDEESLLEHARRSTGLSDFGEDGWRDHFRFLLKCLNEEAGLSLVGRLITRAEILTYLEARLQVAEEYKRHPEIENQEIKEPVFILGFGRSGTTILLETLGLDPQFRSVKRWEGLLPAPSPEEATYESDPRIVKSGNLFELLRRVTPNYVQAHHAGPEVLVEDLEFTYSAFFSEVWSLVFQVPSFSEYFNERSPDDHFKWHKRVLKLLQWKFKRKHWLLKNPTHMPRVGELLKFYPDAKIIFPHRDPVITSDSIINIQGIIYSQRSDDIFVRKSGTDWWHTLESRVKIWDDVIDLIEDGTLHKGNFSNVLYSDLVRDPLDAIEKVYDELGLNLDDQVLANMKSFLDERNKSSLGTRSVYAKSEVSDPRTIKEREAYRRYQEYFGIENEN